MPKITIMNHKQCAAFLGASVHTLHKWRAETNDPLPFHKARAKAKYFQDDVARWAKRRNRRVFPDAR